MIEFDQRASLVPYIEFNIQLRTRAKNNFEKDFFKLMNNSVFGKMMENIREQRHINLVTNQGAYLKRAMQLNFKLGIVFSENLMKCEKGKIRVIINKTVYLSQAILDLSKIIMYKFHYDYMKQNSMAGIFNCVTWTPTPWIMASRLVISMKTLPAI